MSYQRLALGCLLAGIALTGCSKKAEETPMGSAASQLPTAKVVLAESVAEEVAALVEVTGTVQATERASIAPKVMGTISEFAVDLGQQVKKGDLLVKIDAAEINAKALQAQTQLSQAKRDLERERGLLEKGASTSEMVKNLSDRVTIMEAMVKEAETMLGYTEIRAPFDGAVARKLSDVGNLSAPGMPLLELEGSGGFEIEAGIPESLAGSLKVGDRFQANLPASGQAFEVTLAEVSSGSSGYSRSTAARFAVPGEVAVRAGQFAKVTLDGEKHVKVLAPASSVSKLGQMERIFIAKDGTAQLRIVKTGAKQGGQIEVLSGLEAGESVVARTDQPLVDGQPITVSR